MPLALSPNSIGRKTPCLENPARKGGIRLTSENAAVAFTLTGTTGSVQIVLRGSRGACAGRVEGALLVFRAVVDQRAAFLVDHIAEKPFGSDLSQGRIFVQVADDLAAQHPKVCPRAFGWSSGKDSMMSDAR